MKKCLIVVDYQPDFVTGKHGFAAAAALAEPIARRMVRYHAAGNDVLITLDAAAEPELFGAAGSVLMPQDKRFSKACYGSGQLFDYLRDTPYAALELAGVETDVCVLANAVLCQAAQPETPVLVNAGCVASPDAARHRAALLVMKGMKMHVLEGIGTSGVES